MIKIIDKKKCCGCESCVQKCPHHCLKMLEDEEGFLYPSVDLEQCVNCGLCKSVCPVLSPFEERRPLKLYAAINKSDEIRNVSSSGGVFYILAEYVISQGGVIFGVKFDEQWNVVFDYTDTQKGIHPFLGSKYVQATIGNAYCDAENFLKEGRKVLFSGTPCQIAGLYHYIKKEYDNLITVDVVCHGVPSPKVWRNYLDEIAEPQAKIRHVNFRDKTKGWHDYGVSLIYETDMKRESILCHHRNNQYMQAFLYNISLRPSCYACEAKSGKSKSDITIADFWGVEDEISEMNDDKGTSLILVNTNRGMKVIDFSKLKCRETSYEIALKNNSCISSSVYVPSQMRDKFFRAINNNKTIGQSVAIALSPSIKNRVFSKIRILKKRIFG